MNTHPDLVFDYVIPFKILDNSDKYSKSCNIYETNTNNIIGKIKITTIVNEDSFFIKHLYKLPQGNISVIYKIVININSVYKTKIFEQFEKNTLYSSKIIKGTGDFINSCGIVKIITDDSQRRKVSITFDNSKNIKKPLKNINIDSVNYKMSDIKYAIKNNEPIEEKLNVIIVVSNPCLYSRRYKLLNEFVRRFEEEEQHVNLFVVEMIYENQEYIVTDKNNKNHLQLKTQTPLWHKENMINLGVKYLLPNDWKAFAWIDADIEFESNTWALDTLKILNGTKDVVQLFSHAVDMNYDESSINHFNSFGYSFSKNKIHSKIKNINYWHPGYAWGINRKAYDKIGGLYEKNILGSGDYLMALCFINKFEKNDKCKYNQDVLTYQNNAKQLSLGYVPGVIRHYFHGTKQNRKYNDRWKILFENNYSQEEHITYDNIGIIVPTNKFPQQLIKDIMNYFVERKEDD